MSLSPSTLSTISSSITGTTASKLLDTKGNIYGQHQSSASSKSGSTLSNEIYDSLTDIGQHYYDQYGRLYKRQVEIDRLVLTNCNEGFNRKLKERIVLNREYRTSIEKLDNALKELGDTERWANVINEKLKLIEKYSSSSSKIK